MKKVLSRVVLILFVGCSFNFSYADTDSAEQEAGLRSSSEAIEKLESKLIDLIEEKKTLDKNLEKAKSNLETAQSNAKECMKTTKNDTKSCKKRIDMEEEFSNKKEDAQNEVDEIKNEMQSTTEELLGEQEKAGNNIECLKAAQKQLGELNSLEKEIDTLRKDIRDIDDVISDVEKELKKTETLKTSECQKNFNSIACTNAVESIESLSKSLDSAREKEETYVNEYDNAKKTYDELEASREKNLDPKSCQAGEAGNNNLNSNDLLSCESIFSKKPMPKNTADLEKMKKEVVTDLQAFYGKEYDVLVKRIDDSIADYEKKLDEKDIKDDVKKGVELHRNTLSEMKEIFILPFVNNWQDYSKAKSSTEDVIVEKIVGKDGNGGVLSSVQSIPDVSELGEIEVPLQGLIEKNFLGKNRDDIIEGITDQVAEDLNDIYSTMKDLSAMVRKSDMVKNGSTKEKGARETYWADEYAACKDCDDQGQDHDANGQCCGTKAKLAKKDGVCCPTANISKTTLQCCAAGLTTDGECIANNYGNMGINCSPDQLIRGTCSMSTYKMLGIRKSNQDPDGGTFIQDIILTLTSFIGVVVTISLIVAGLKFVIGGASESQSTDAKTGLKYAILGLFLVAFSYTIIRLVQYIAKG